jgi:hypothetical protein
MGEKIRGIGFSLVPAGIECSCVVEQRAQDGGRVIANKRQGHANHLGNG